MLLGAAAAALTYGFGVLVGTGSRAEDRRVAPARVHRRGRMASVTGR